MKEETNIAFHFLSRRTVAEWANKLDPDLIVKHRDDAKLPKIQKEAIRHIAESLRRAFEADDEYERDWLLTGARWLNAQAVLRADGLLRYLSDLPGVIPMARDTTMERYISYVQRHAAHTMSVCPECGICFFKRKLRQQMCGQKCRLRRNKKNKQAAWQLKGAHWNANR